MRFSTEKKHKHKTQKKQKHNLKVENYVLFDGLSENFKSRR